MLEILRVHLAGEKLDEDLNLPLLARLTENYSGSDLKSTVLLAHSFSGL